MAYNLCLLLLNYCTVKILLLLLLLLIFIYWLHPGLIAAHRIFAASCRIFCCGARILVAAHGLQSCGVQAQLLQGIWGLNFPARDQSHTPIPWTEKPGSLQSMGLQQCSCLENPRDVGAWWAAVYGVAQSRTRLKRLSSSSRVTVSSLLFLFLNLFLVG